MAKHFDPTWMNHYLMELRKNKTPLLFTGLDLGKGDATAIAVVELGKSGWEIVETKDLRTLEHQSKPESE